MDTLEQYMTFIYRIGWGMGVEKEGGRKLSFVLKVLYEELVR